ncbi:MAG: hypothetical protein NVS2B14_07530 [Chamaesiphon sp.]
MSAEIVKELFATGESMNSEKFVTFFTEYARYRFGNYDPCIGRDAIKASVAAFFSNPNLKGLFHDIERMWEVEDKQLDATYKLVFCKMDVIYTLNSGKIARVPFFDFFKFEGDLIQDMAIYGDPSPLA